QGLHAAHRDNPPGAGGAQPPAAPGVPGHDYVLAHPARAEHRGRRARPVPGKHHAHPHPPQHAYRRVSQLRPVCLALRPIRPRRRGIPQPCRRHRLPHSARPPHGQAL
ncbi:MAG: hypothetical protein AVDCRST_MAG77-3244, partial [uncultured Chloroflexi bacterium]